MTWCATDSDLCFSEGSAPFGWSMTAGGLKEQRGVRGRGETLKFQVERKTETIDLDLCFTGKCLHLCDRWQQEVCKRRGEGGWWGERLGLGISSRMQARKKEKFIVSILRKPVRGQSQIRTILCEFAVQSHTRRTKNKATTWKNSLLICDCARTGLHNMETMNFSFFLPCILFEIPNPSLSPHHPPSPLLLQTTCCHRSHK